MITSKSKGKYLLRSDGYDWIDNHRNGGRKNMRDCKKFFSRKRRRRLKKIEGE